MHATLAYSIEYLSVRYPFYSREAMESFVNATTCGDDMRVKYWNGYKETECTLGYLKSLLQLH